MVAFIEDFFYWSLFDLRDLFMHFVYFFNFGKNVLSTEGIVVFLKVLNWYGGLGGIVALVLQAILIDEWDVEVVLASGVLSVEWTLDVNRGDFG